MADSVLDATAARGVYERIVRQRRVPGLLRYVGRGCLQANIFPVPTNGDVEVEVTLRHILPEVGGLSVWSFPVATAGLAGVTPTQVVLNLTVQSTCAHLTNAFSPNAGLHVVCTSETEALASLEGPGAGLEDLQVFYGTGQTEFRLDLMSYLAARATDDDFVPIVVFLTDGRPPLGQKNTGPLLASIQSGNERAARLFVMGVGNDVNAPLLDQMAAQASGMRNYVRPGEDFEIAVSALFQQLSHPVMTGLTLTIEGAEAAKMSPEQLPTGSSASASRSSGATRGRGRRARASPARSPARCVATSWSRRSRPRPTSASTSYRACRPSSASRGCSTPCTPRARTRSCTTRSCGWDRSTTS